MKERALLVGLALVAAASTLPAGGCTKPNPNVCCVTDAQCADLGAGELRPCDVGQACAPDFTCVAAQCSTNADCDAASPVCSLGFCESTCAVDDDCAGVAGRTHCSSDGACVECTDSSECSGAENICDAQAHSCRGCEHDNECVSGVCIEADGLCATEDRVVYVGTTTGHDTGTCPKEMPCTSVEYAFAHMQGGRDVVHVAGALAVLSAAINVSKPLILDATNTVLQLPSPGAAFTFSGGGNLLIENATLGRGSIPIGAGAGLRLYAVEVMLDATGLQVTGGSLAITDSKLSAITPQKLSCSANGQISVLRSTMDGAGLESTGCDVLVSRSTFTSRSSDMLFLSQGRAQVENSLFVQNDEVSDSVNIQNAPGSTFRFNTVVCTSALTADAVALWSDSTVAASSNIFAYNSTNPIVGSPTITYSLFDTPGAVDAGSNMVADAAAIFVDFAGGDFHASANGAAHANGEAGVTDVDLEGKARSVTPDIGAFEGQ